MRTRKTILRVAAATIHNCGRAACSPDKSEPASQFSIVQSSGSLVWESSSEHPLGLPARQIASGSTHQDPEVNDTDMGKKTLGVAG